ncbi:hypothetical protein FQK00_17460 [Xanthomonas vasicola]|nr:hypothetical protein FQK00_17460 [Xanthomonas vasicola]
MVPVAAAGENESIATKVVDIPSRNVCNRLHVMCVTGCVVLLVSLESGIGNRESGIGNRESGIGNRKS